MKASVSVGAVALALLLAGCGDGGSGKAGGGAGGASAAPIPAPNGGDWTQTVQQTPEGGYRMGNPNAPTKLVEYASISCSHCAEFEEEGAAPLRDQYVKSGRVSWEYRPFMIFPTDPGIFMLLQCRGPQTFFPLAGQLYADQRNWLGKLQTLSAEQQQQLAAMAPQQQITALVKATGMDQFFRQRGMPEAQISSCLANQQSLQQLMAVTNTGTNEYKVTGTPAFFINGDQVELNPGKLWNQLEPKLKDAGA
jgi:protein-disulfide isomerase